MFLRFKGEQTGKKNEEGGKKLRASRVESRYQVL